MLFQQLWEVVFDPLPTTGVPLATRPDWREILAPLRSYCMPMLWFAFHGTSEVHDRMVQRQGAYQESLRAVALAREAQVHTGCTLFLTSENVSHFDQLVSDLLQAGMESIDPCVYDFTPNARGRLTERVELARKNGDSKVGDSFPSNGIGCSKATGLTYSHVECVNACAILRPDTFDASVVLFIPGVDTLQGTCSDLFDRSTRLMHSPPLRKARLHLDALWWTAAPRRANERYTSEPAPRSLVSSAKPTTGIQVVHAFRPLLPQLAHS